MANVLDSEVQWIGTSKLGEGPQCLTVVNYEPRFPGFAQVVAVSLDDNHIGMASDATMQISGTNVSGVTNNYRVFDSKEDRMVPLEEQFQRNNAKEKPPTRADFKGVLDNNRFSGSYTNDLGEVGEFRLYRVLLKLF